MKKWIVLLVWASFFVAVIIAMFPSLGLGQCSICTKTAQQLGKKSAEGLNTGIIYLMLIPFVIGGFIAFRWWRQERSTEKQV